MQVTSSTKGNDAFSLLQSVNDMQQHASRDIIHTIILSMAHLNDASTTRVALPVVCMITCTVTSSSEDQNFELLHVACHYVYAKSSIVMFATAFFDTSAHKTTKNMCEMYQ